jgi:GTP cyclohydrolase I
MADSIRNILKDLGEDPNREGLLNTPERHARALLFLTKGYNEDIFDIAKAAMFEVDHKSIVLIRDIDLFSMCEHHLLPFWGKV